MSHLKFNERKNKLSKNFRAISKVEHMINWNTRRRKNSEENLFEVIITKIIPTLTDTKLREHPAGY